MAFWDLIGHSQGAGTSVASICCVKESRPSEVISCCFNRPVLCIRAPVLAGAVCLADMGCGKPSRCSTPIRTRQTWIGSQGNGRYPEISWPVREDRKAVSETEQLHGIWGALWESGWKFWSSCKLYRLVSFFEVDLRKTDLGKLSFLLFPALLLETLVI